MHKTNIFLILHKTAYSSNLSIIQFWPFGVYFSLFQNKGNLRKKKSDLKRIHWNQWRCSQIFHMHALSANTLTTFTTIEKCFIYKKIENCVLTNCKSTNDEPRVEIPHLQFYLVSSTSKMLVCLYHLCLSTVSVRSTSKLYCPKAGSILSISTQNLAFKRNVRVTLFILVCIPHS